MNQPCVSIVEDELLSLGPETLLVIGLFIIFKF